MTTDAANAEQQTYLPPALRPKLAKLGIQHLRDVLLHFPMRYEDQTQVRPISELVAGESVVVEGVVEHAETQFKPRRQFVVLLRGASPEQAFARLDQVRSELAQRRLVNRATDTPFGQVTFSAGVAEVFTHGDPRSALQAADAALYRAKAAGRNRIELAGLDDTPLASAA